MRALILMLCLVAPQARADAPPLSAEWADLDRRCEAWELQSTKDAAPSGSAWEAREKAAQENIVHFTKEVCPAYLGSANATQSVGQKGAAVTLEKFTAELQKVYADVTITKELAERLKQYLDQNIEKLGRFFAGGGFPLDGHPCGARFLERRKFVQAELDRLEQNVTKIKTQCPAIAGAIDAKAQAAAQKAASAAKGAAGAPAKVSAGQGAKGTSDITGTKKDPTGKRIR